MDTQVEVAVNLSDKNLNEIPEEVRLKCGEVCTLDLSKNHGIFTNNCLRRFVNIKRLLFAECGLITIPDEISELTQLEELDFSRNELSNALNPALRQLEGLKRLQLQDCKLTRLPDWIGDFQQLQQLQLGGNDFSTGLNPAIGRLRSLRNLHLDSCGLPNLPDTIGNLEQLQELQLGSNEFSTDLNPAIGQLRSLTKLHLDSCQLPNIPDSIGNLEQLQVLTLQGNNFTSGRNPALGQLRTLRMLQLNSCVSLNLPDLIRKLEQLQEQQLRSNEFSTGLSPATGLLGNLSKVMFDILPDSIEELEQLQELQLGGNTVSTGLNPAIGQLRSLRMLTLDRCGLQNVPDSIGNLEQLQELQLGGNKFSTGINPAIGQLRSLTMLSLDRCGLPNLPDSIGNLEQLQKLYLAINKFSTGLNPAIGQLQSLRMLNLATCELPNLPDSIGNLAQLQELQLGHNKFSTGLNPAVGQLRSLRILNLASCEMPNLPDSIGNLEQLQELQLGGNKFSTGLNPAIGQLRSLTMLSLDRCGLPNLPDSIGNLEQLETLIISSNILEEYPRSTLCLKNLLHIDLSNSILDIDGNRIKNLPVEFAYTNIVNLELKGNPITEPPKEIWTQGAQAVRSFMRAVLPGGELMHADTLNMIGDTGAGKTSVTLSMIANSPQRTEDADRTHVLQQCRLMFEDGLGRCVVINDFGGHDIYHSVMPIFLPANGLIILVCNLVDKCVEEQVKKWMLTALAKSKEFRLIVVGTHADQVTNIKAREYLVTGSDQRSTLEMRLESISSDYFEMAVKEVNANITQLECRADIVQVQEKLNALRDLRENLKRATVCGITLSCLFDDGGLRRLRDVVTRSLRPPHIMPVRWCQFMTSVLNPHADRLYIAMQEVERLCREHFTEEDDSNTLTTILRYLVETSQIIWLENHPFLKDFIFHCPQKILNSCKQIFNHDNVVPTSLTFYDAEFNQYSQGILQEPLLRKLLTAQTENQNASEALHPELFEVVVSFLQQCNLISFVRKTEAGKQFIVPCKLTATEPQEMLLELQKKGSECLNRVTVKLSFIGSIIPLSLFETSLSSILNVTGDISQHVVWPKVWKDGAIISHNGVTLITKRIDAVILLTAFSEPSFPSPWTILQPVLKRLYESVMASWHGAPPTCVIVCPWCDRQKPSNAQVAEIRINLTTLVAEDKPSNERLTCEMCLRAIPPSLCFPTMEAGSFITYQSEIETFFRVAVAKRKKMLQDDGGPSKLPKQLDAVAKRKKLLQDDGGPSKVPKKLESDEGENSKSSELLRRLRKATPQLVQGLDRQSVEFIVDELLAARDGHGHITYGHCQEIQAETTDIGKARKLLHIVGARGDEAIEALAQSLKCDGVGRRDLANLILEPRLL